MVHCRQPQDILRHLEWFIADFIMVHIILHCITSGHLWPRYFKSSPADPMYLPVFRFLMAKPVVDLSSVPEFYRLFFSAGAQVWSVCHCSLLYSSSLALFFVAQLKIWHCSLFWQCSLYNTVVKYGHSIRLWAISAICGLTISCLRAVEEAWPAQT